MDRTERLYELWQDPIGDPRLDEILNSSKNQVSEVVNALLERQLQPTPERVTALMRHLGLPPLDPDRLRGLLMGHWWITLNETIEPDDIEALQAHLERAPIPEHRCCYYLMGLIAGLTASHCLSRYGVSSNSRTTKAHGERRWL